MALVPPPPLSPPSPDSDSVHIILPRRAQAVASAVKSTLPSAATLHPTPAAVVQASSAPTSSIHSVPVTTASLTTGTTAASSAVPSPPDADPMAPRNSVSVPSRSAASLASYVASSGTANGAADGRESAPPRPRSEAGATPATGANTPQTGAGRLAAAAAAGSKRREEASHQKDEEHPLSDRNLAARGYHTLHAMQHQFHVSTRWKLLRPLGQGAYGLVISVQDEISGEPVAIKCITRVFDKPILARRALREITLLRHFGEHENLTGLIDLDNVWDGYNEIYLYVEPMEADLHQIVRSGQALSNLHIQFFLYQLLRGMKYIHSANVIHRDLKPGNLLVNSDCELKICDFGLARGFNPSPDPHKELRMTEYVATRWYRAPEIMLSNRSYTTAIDVWSIGCILGELLGGKPLFKGKDYVDQLNLILGVLGTPDDETLHRISSEKARIYLKTLPRSERVPMEDVFPEAEHDAVDLLTKLLTFDPDERIDVQTALQHPYVGTYHDPADEPICEEPFNKWEEVESLQTIEELRAAITREITEYRAEVRGEYDYEYDEEAEDEYSASDDLEVIDDEDETVVEEDGEEETIRRSTSPQALRRGLGVDGSPSGSPHVRKVPLPRRVTSGDRRRDDSPMGSEESFGHTPGAGTAGRTSRRSSSHSSMHRRSMSFLFGGVGGMTSLSMTSAPGAGAGQAGPAEGGRQRSDSAVTSASSNETAGWGMQGRRSRAPSSSVEIGSLRPLIRQLSATNLQDVRANTDDEPMGTHTPDVLKSRRGSRSGRSSRSRRRSSVCVAELAEKDRPPLDAEDD